MLLLCVATQALAQLENSRLPWCTIPAHELTLVSAVHRPVGTPMIEQLCRDGSQFCRDVAGSSFAVPRTDLQTCILWLLPFSCVTCLPVYTAAAQCQ